MKRIAWLPAHPAMGWASMNRCWLALQRQSALHPAHDLAFTCPLALQAVEQREAPAWRRHLARRLTYPLRVRSLRDVDAVHVLDHSFADLLRHVPKRVKKIVTVHDVIPLLDAAELSAAQVARYRERLNWLHQADVLICVSEFTRRTLLEHLKVDASKTVVLPNGVDLPTAKPALLKLDALRPWLLIVGSNLERKNLRLLPEVLKHLMNRDIHPTVVRVGPSLKTELKMAIQEIVGPERLLELGLVSDAQLSAAYASADMLLFPSTLEGFGLPVLEAMAHSCPVVCSNASSLPEVAGSAALLFAPHDAASAAEQCVTAITNRAQLSALGLQRAQLFTWTQHWNQLCTLYRELLAA